MTKKTHDDPPEETPVEEIAEHPLRIPVDPATGKPYKSGEIPPGCNEPIP